VVGKCVDNQKRVEPVLGYLKEEIDIRNGKVDGEGAPRVIFQFICQIIPQQ
jgi:hypothetical protein